GYPGPGLLGLRHRPVERRHDVVDHMFGPTAGLGVHADHALYRSACIGHRHPQLGSAQVDADEAAHPGRGLDRRRVRAATAAPTRHSSAVVRKMTWYSSRMAWRKRISYCTRRTA